MDKQIGEIMTHAAHAGVRRDIFRHEVRALHELHLAYIQYISKRRRRVSYYMVTGAAVEKLFITSYLTRQHVYLCTTLRLGATVPKIFHNLLPHTAT